MPKRILIIDDDSAVRCAFQLALRGEGYEILEADSGAAGVRLALAEDLDLVYLDLRMPGIDGVETLRRIRAAKPDLVVYIVTAFHREFFDELIQARQEGLRFELLRKPLERQQIISITADILDAEDSEAPPWF